MKKSDWKRYENIITGAFDNWGNQEVIWHRNRRKGSRFQEGGQEDFDLVPMKALVDYNAFRTWPTDILKATGIEDKQYCNLLFNRKYLKENGWLTSEGNFKFDPGYDRFQLQGVMWKPAGDTPISQTNDNPHVYMVILVRDEYITSINPRP
jgi:hypothetical protein